jgi:hypothetical protein
MPFTQFNVRRPHRFHSERRPSYSSVTSRAWAWLGKARHLPFPSEMLLSARTLSVRQHQTPNYESGGQEFESLRARQILTIHRYKWQAKRCAMQNGLICMASAWHRRRFTTDSKIAFRRFKSSPVQRPLPPRAGRPSDRGRRWHRGPSARSSSRSRRRAGQP